MNTKRSSTIHIIIIMAKFKDKERTLKAARERQLVTYRRASIRLSAYFSIEILQARKDLQEISRS